MLSLSDNNQAVNEAYLYELLDVTTDTNIHNSCMT